MGGLESRLGPCHYCTARFAVVDPTAVAGDPFVSDAAVVGTSSTLPATSTPVATDKGLLVSFVEKLTSWKVGGLRSCPRALLLLACLWRPRPRLGTFFSAVNGTDGGGKIWGAVWRMSLPFRLGGASYWMIGARSHGTLALLSSTLSCAVSCTCFFCSGMLQSQACYEGGVDGVVCGVLLAARFVSPLVGGGRVDRGDPHPHARDAAVPVRLWTIQRDSCWAQGTFRYNHGAGGGGRLCGLVFGFSHWGSVQFSWALSLAWQRVH